MLVQYSAYCFFALLTAASAAAVTGADTTHHSLVKRVIMEDWDAGQFSDCVFLTQPCGYQVKNIRCRDPMSGIIYATCQQSFSVEPCCINNDRPIPTHQFCNCEGGLIPTPGEYSFTVDGTTVTLTSNGSSLMDLVIVINFEYGDGTTEDVTVTMENTMYSFSTIMGPGTSFGVQSQFLSIGGQATISVMDAISIAVPQRVEVTYSNGALSYGSPSPATIDNYYFLSRLGVLYPFGSTDTVENAGGGTLFLDRNANALYTTSVNSVATIVIAAAPTAQAFPFAIEINVGALTFSGVTAGDFVIDSSTTALTNPQTPIVIPDIGPFPNGAMPTRFLLVGVVEEISSGDTPTRTIDTFDELFYHSDSQTLLISTFPEVSETVSGMIAHALVTPPPITATFEITPQSVLTFIGAPVLSLTSSTLPILLADGDTVAYSNGVAQITISGAVTELPISVLHFYDQINQQVTVAFSSSSDVLSGPAILYVTGDRAFFVADSTIQKDIDNRLSSLQQMVVTEDGRQVLQIDGNDVLTITGGQSFSSTPFTGMVNVSFANGLLSVDGQSFSPISQFYYDNGDRITLFAPGDPSFTTSGSGTLYVSGDQAFFTTVTAHTDFITDQRTASTVSVPTATHSLTGTTLGMSDVIITDSATGDTYTAVSVGGTGFSSVDISADVDIAYSNGIISFGSETYSAPTHFAVYQSGSADIYFGNLPMATSISSGPTGSTLYLDAEGRVLLTNVADLISMISIALTPTVMFNDPVIDIVTGATSVVVRFGNSDVFDLSGADAYFIPANHEYEYSADSLTVSDGTSVILTFAMTVSVLAENPENVYNDYRENSPAFSRSVPTYLLVRTDDSTNERTAFVTGNSALVNRFYREKYSVANSGSNNPSLEYLTSNVLPLANLMTVEINQNTAYTFTAASGTLTVASMEIGSGFTQFVLDLMSASSTTPDPVDPTFFTVQTSSMPITAGTNFYYSGEFAFATNIDSVKNLIDEERPATVDPGIITNPTIGSEQVGNQVFLTLADDTQVHRVVAVLGPGAERVVSSAISYSMNVITYTDANSVMSTQPATMLYILNAVGEDAMIFTGMRTTPIPGPGALYFDGNTAFFSADPVIWDIIALFPVPTTETPTLTPTTSTTSPVTTMTTEPATLPPTTLPPARDLADLVVRRGQLVLVIDDDEIVTLTGDDADSFQVGAGITVMYSFDSMTNMFTVTAGGRSFTRSSFISLMSDGTMTVTHSGSGSFVTTGGGTIYADLNTIFFTDDSSLLEEIAIMLSVDDLPDAPEPTAEDTSSWALGQQSACSRSCGAGFQVRFLGCTDANGMPLTGCAEPLSPIRDNIPPLFVICGQGICPGEDTITQGIPREGTTIVNDDSRGQVILTTSNVDFQTDIYTVEAVFGHPEHGSVFTQTMEQIDGSITRHQTVDLRTGLRPEEELIKVNILHETFEIEIIDVVNDNVAYVIQPFLMDEQCFVPDDPGGLISLNNLNAGEVCVNFAPCFFVNTLVKYDRAQGFLTMPIDADFLVASPFGPFSVSLEAALFCVSPSTQTAFYVGIPSAQSDPSVIPEQIHTSYSAISSLLVAPRIVASDGSVEVTRSSSDVHIGMSITAVERVRDLELICYLDPAGVPSPTTVWLKDDEPIQDSAQYNIRSDSRTLTFSRITDQDAGNYTCSVSNALGTDSVTSTLTVVAEDEITEPAVTDVEETTAPPSPQWVLGGDWTECTRTCGVGVRVRVLECIDPAGTPSDECDPADIESQGVLPFELCGTAECFGEEARFGIPEDQNLTLLASSRLGAVNVSIAISNSDVMSRSYILTYDATNVDGSTINIVFSQSSAGTASVTPTITLQMPQFAKIEFEFLTDNTIAVYIDGRLTYYINSRDGAECYEVKESESFTYSNSLLTVDQAIQSLQPFEPINYVEGVTFMGRLHFSMSAPMPFYGPLTLCVDVSGQSAFFVNVPNAIDDLNNILDGFRRPLLNRSGEGDMLEISDILASIRIGQDLRVEIGATVRIRADFEDFGSPYPPEIVWTKNGQVIESRGTLLISFDGLQAYIHNFQPADSGEYAVTVSNIAGEDTVRSRIEANIENGIIVRPPPPPTSPSVETFGVGEGTFTVSTPGVVTQVGIFCPVVVADGNQIDYQTWLRNGTVANDTTPGITTTLPGIGGDTYRLGESFPDGVPEYCLEYVCVVGISGEEFRESVQVCGRVETPPTSIQITGETTVRRGGSAMLNCTAMGGSPSPALKWSISPGADNIQAQYTILSNGSLFLMNIPANEDTMYCCEAFNDFGTTGEMCISLTVQYLPVIDNPRILQVDFTPYGRGSFTVDAGQRVEVVAGSNVTIRCNASLGNPMGIRTWLKNGVAIPLDSPLYVVQGDGSLFLPDVTNMEVHEADFTCLVENDLGFDQETSWVLVYVPPEIEVGTQVMFVQDANSVISIFQSNIVYVAPELAFCLECTENNGFPESEFFFLRNDKHIDFRDPHLFQNGSRLCFRGIIGTYSGTYSCTAVNTAGTDKGSVQIAVGEIPVIQAPVYPALPVGNFVDRTERREVAVDVGFNVAVTAGASLSLRCGLRKSGVPPVSAIEWFYEGNSINMTDEDVQIQPDGTLYINSVAMSDAGSVGEEGTYECRASNTFGTDQATTEVRVEGVSPTINTDFEFQNRLRGTYQTTVGASQQIVNIQLYDSFLIRCDASGSFAPDIRWEIENFNASNLVLHAVQPDGSLLVTGETELSCNRYTCFATNAIGVVQESVEICGETITPVELGRSACSATCGPSAHRTVLFGYERTVDGLPPVPIDTSLVPIPLLADEQIIFGDCPPTPCPEPVYVYVAGDFEPCSVTCGVDVIQRRPLLCERREDGQSLGEMVDINFCHAFSDSDQPVLDQPCAILPCPRWQADEFSECSTTCGTGLISRNVICVLSDTDDGTGNPIISDQCVSDDMPEAVRACYSGTCPYTWLLGLYGPCSTTCQGGTQMRTVDCYDTSREDRIDNQLCLDQHLVPPTNTRDCGTLHCPHFVWRTEANAAGCSATCDGGTLMMDVICYNTITNEDVDDRFCNAEWKPASAVTCNTERCDTSLNPLCVLDFLNICGFYAAFGLCHLANPGDCCASCSLA